MRAPLTSLCGLCGLSLITVSLLAQPPQPPLKDERPFQSGIEITSVTATVTDKDGHLVHDLPREAFEVYEDGVRQTITQFTRDRVPIGLGVLLDISDSMYGQRIQDARSAVDRFLRWKIASRVAGLSVVVPYVDDTKLVAVKGMYAVALTI